MLIGEGYDLKTMKQKPQRKRKIKRFHSQANLFRWDASFSVDEPHTIATREARFPDSKLATGCEPQPWAAVP